MDAAAHTRRSSATRIGALFGAVVLALALVPAVPAQAQDPPFNRGLSSACSSDAQAYDVFADVSPGTHYASINCVAYFGVTLGIIGADGTAVFDPQASVTRQQMASFIARMMDRGAFDFPEPEQPPFEDVASAHRDNVERLRAAGVVEGFPDGTYGGTEAVTREQMASFIARAIETVTGQTLPTAAVFPDRGAAVHATNVDKLAAIGVVQGRADGTYAPQQDITREQMASFLARAMDYLAEQGIYADEVLPVPGEPRTDARSQDASDGARLTVTDVHVGIHPGFDRVVLEVEGDGTAGWHAGYIDLDAVDATFDFVGGEQVLEVTVDGWPADDAAGIAPYQGSEWVGSTAVVEVVADDVFQGERFFIGTTRHKPFVVDLVDGNIVIDVFHAG